MDNDARNELLSAVDTLVENINRHKERVRAISDVIVTMEEQIEHQREKTREAEVRYNRLEVSRKW